MDWRKLSVRHFWPENLAILPLSHEGEIPCLKESKRGPQDPPKERDQTPTGNRKVDPKDDVCWAFSRIVAAKIGASWQEKEGLLPGETCLAQDKKASSNSPWSFRKGAKGQLLACSSFEGPAVDGLQGRTEVPVSLSLPFLKYNRKAKDHERVEAAFLPKRQRLTQMSWKRGPRGSNCAGSQRSLESLINIFRKIWEDTVARTPKRGLWTSGDREDRLKLIIWKCNF